MAVEMILPIGNRKTYRLNQIANSQKNILSFIRYPLAPKIGFVLLELIIVVFIIGTLSLLTLPNFRRFSREVFLETASRNLSQCLRFAHFRSVSEGINYRLSFDLEKGSYWLEKVSDNNEELEKLSTSLIREKKLTQNIEFLKIITPRGETTFLGKAYLDFFPDGSGENGLIYLENKEKKINTIELKASTSRVVIYDYEYKKD